MKVMTKPTKKEDLQRLMTETTLDMATSFRLVGVGKNAGYAAREKGQIPSIEIGGQYRCPTAKLREKLGIPDPPYPSASAEAA